MKTKALAIIITAAMLSACRHPAAEQKPVTIAASTEVAATGLPQLLLKRFVGETHVKATFIAASDEALESAARSGKIDVAIVNSPAVVAAFRHSNLVKLGSVFAYDDYIIAGPRKDPARARSAKTAAEAFRRIVRSRHRFCSPADVQGLRERENQVWSLAKINPKKARYVLCHGTAAAALDEANRLDAYTITDRATIATVKASRLEPLLEGVPMLHNDYTAVLLTAPEKNRNAEWFMQWLMSYRGRDAVEDYRFDGGRRFFLAEQRF